MGVADGLGEELEVTELLSVPPEVGEELELAVLLLLVVGVGLVNAEVLSVPLGVIVALEDSLEVTKPLPVSAAEAITVCILLSLPGTG